MSEPKWYTPKALGELRDLDHNIGDLDPDKVRATVEPYSPTYSLSHFSRRRLSSSLVGS